MCDIHIKTMLCHYMHRIWKGYSHPYKSQWYTLRACNWFSFQVHRYYQLEKECVPSTLPKSRRSGTSFGLRAPKTCMPIIAIAFPLTHSQFLLATATVGQRNLLFQEPPLQSVADTTEVGQGHAGLLWACFKVFYASGRGSPCGRWLGNARRMKS